VELKKYEEARQRAMDQRDAQNKQLDQLKAKLLAEQATDRKEGLLLKQRAEKVGRQGVGRACCLSRRRRRWAGRKHGKPASRAEGGGGGRAESRDGLLLEQKAEEEGEQGAGRASYPSRGWKLGPISCTSSRWCPLKCPQGPVQVAQCIHTRRSRWWFLGVQEAAEMRAKELARVAKGKEHNEATRQANATLQAFKLKELERQREQERAIEEYSAKKAKQQVRARCVLRACSALVPLFAADCSQGPGLAAGPTTDWSC